MKLLLCLCLASLASAAPSFFHYVPHFAPSRQQVPPPTQVKNAFPAGQTLTQPGQYSMELPLSSHGFIKYSIPQPAGRQSVEVYYPYDFSQQRVLPFEFPPQNVPQLPNMNPFDANPLPSQDPLQPLQQDQPTQADEVPVKV